MTDQKVVSSPPGTEARHYLVFAPGTPPLGRDTDLCITQAFADLVGGTSKWMVLTIRLANPAQVQQPQDLWRHVRVIPLVHTFHKLGNRFGCSGQAWLLNEVGMETGEELTFFTEFKVADEEPGVILGELKLE